MSTISRVWTVGVVAAVVSVASAAQDAPKTIQAGDLSFKIPSSWKSERPSNAMRKAQIKINPVAGDDEPAELVVTAFPGAAGGVEANVKRWEGQFEDGDKNTPKAKVEERKGVNVSATRVEVAGRYVASMTPGAAKKYDKANYRLLGAIVLTKDMGYFFKLTGPDKTVLGASKAFDAMIESMSVDQ
jgi:hypothetical protein